MYQGEKFTYDARETAIGDTTVRIGNTPDPIETLVIDIRLKSSSSSHIIGNSTSSKLSLNAHILLPQLVKFLMWTIITADEIYEFIPPTTTTTDSYSLVLFISEVRIRASTSDTFDPSNPTSAPTPEFLNSSTDYRGQVTPDTSIFITIQPQNAAYIDLTNNPPVPVRLPLENIVYIETSDNEVFPVERALLRPCLTLTGLVQQGRGKYATTTDQSSSSPASKIVLESTEVNNQENPTKINVDACTFDRVLLYLEHEYRHEVFKFDPLIVTDLLTAAQTLKISGLEGACERVLGSFSERVRKVPIRYSEVVSRNTAGGVCTGTMGSSSTTGKEGSNSSTGSTSTGIGKRGETWLIMSGMVLDITRWLDEHPGGSTIIPQQALNVDCTVFFEIYHASKQSFLYLKEFYIGELAVEDLALVPLPSQHLQQSPAHPQQSHTQQEQANRQQPQQQLYAQPSPAFLDQLNKVCSPWRLKQSDMQSVTYKSF